MRHGGGRQQVELAASGSECTAASEAANCRARVAMSLQNGMVLSMDVKWTAPLR